MAHVERRILLVLVEGTDVGALGLRDHREYARNRLANFPAVWLVSVVVVVVVVVGGVEGGGVGEENERVVGEKRTNG